MGGTGPDFALAFTVVDLWRFPVKSMQGERLDVRRHRSRRDRRRPRLRHRRRRDRPRPHRPARAATARGGRRLPPRRIGDHHAPGRVGCRGRRRPLDLARALRAPSGGAAGDRRPLRDRPRLRARGLVRVVPVGRARGAVPRLDPHARLARVRGDDPGVGSRAGSARTCCSSGAGEEALVGSTVRVGDGRARRRQGDRPLRDRHRDRSRVASTATSTCSGRSTVSAPATSGSAHSCAHPGASRSATRSS